MRKVFADEVFRMRPQLRFAALPLFLVAAASCSKPKPAPAPAPAVAPAATPQNLTPAATAGRPTAPPAMVVQGGGEAGRGGPPGAGGPPGGGRGGPPMTPERRAARRDSISTIRTATLAQVMKDIAGRENEPAGTVFKNVQLLKDMPAGKFLASMDQDFGRALSHNCTDCHIKDQWASDSLNRKKTARVMIAVVNGLNNDLLTKMPVRAGQPTPKVNCITCHHGNGNPGTAIMP
jgi:hypothetical protein